MRNVIVRIGMGLVAASALLFSGCGGGGGAGSSSGTPVSGVAPTYTSIRGLVAYGSGAAVAEIEVHDVEGQLGRTITDAMGGFMLPLATITRALSPPFVIKAKFQIGSTPFNLFSISQGEQGGDVRMNVTPITDVIARLHMAPDGSDPTAVELGDPIPNNPTRLNRIRQNVKEMLGSKLPADVTDFVSENFKTSPTQYTMDALLERVKVELDSTGVKLKTALGRLLAQRALAQMRSDQSQTDDASTITDTESDQADADRGDLPAGEQVEDNVLPIAIANELMFDVADVNDPLNPSFSGVLRGVNVGTFRIVPTSGPSRGQLSLNSGTGAFTYTPSSAGWTGTDEFQFTVSNAFGESTPVRVRLVVSDGCDSSAAGTPTTHTRWCRQPLASAITLIAPANGYPFGVQPESLLVSNEPPELQTYRESSKQSTNNNSANGIDLTWDRRDHDAGTQRYTVTTSGGFYNTSGSRLPAYASRDFTRSRAIYARHPNSAGYVLTGYAFAQMSYDTPTGYDLPYEYGSVTHYTLQGYDASGRPLYQGTQTLCILDIVSAPYSLFAETVKTWSPSGTVVSFTTRAMICSISIDQLAGIAHEVRPADLRHNWN